jgi:hypothetical protein
MPVDDRNDDTGIATVRLPAADFGGPVQGAACRGRRWPGVSAGLSSAEARLVQAGPYS